MISLRIIVVTCYFLFYFSKRLKCSFRANCYLCFKYIFRSNCYLRFNTSLYFVCWIISKSVLDKYEWLWPQYDCYRSRRRHINSPTTNSPTLLVNSRSPFANSPTPSGCRRSHRGCHRSDRYVGELTKGIGELTCHRSDRVPKVHTGLAIQISNVSLILLPVPRKEFCSLDTPHKLFLLQTFPLSTKGWTKYNIKFRKINKKDEKSWAW